MYLPAHFAAKDVGTTNATAHELIRANPFASLISVDDNGLPFVTPLHLLTAGGETLLLGHCPKPNRPWNYLTYIARSRPKLWKPLVTKIACSSI